MKKIWLSVGLGSLLALPAFAQDKEADRGLMTCREGSTFHGPWSAPTMMALEGGSAGLQLGGNATVLLIMSPRSANSILSSKVKVGGDASAAAGPVGRTASAETDVTMRAEILSYSRGLPTYSRLPSLASGERGGDHEFH